MAAVLASNLKAFYDQPRDDHRWLKEQPESVIDSLLETLDFRTHNTLMLHQKVSVLLCLHYDYFMPQLDLGLGKTLVCLEVIAYRKRLGLGHRTLVLVPNLSNLYEWEEQITTHMPTLSHTVMDGTSKARMSQFRKETSDIFILNYGALINLFTHRVKNFNPRTKKKFQRLLKRDAIAEVAPKFSGFVADESTAIKNPQSFYTLVTLALSREASFRIALSGTPFGRDLLDLWSQFRFVDDGATLGHQIGLYQGAFFMRKNNGFAWVWKFDKRRKGVLQKFMQHRSLYYSRAECMDLPESTHRTAYVLATPEIAKYYNEILTAAIQKSSVEFTKNSFISMRQLTSGFLVLHDEDGKTEMPMAHNPKLERLEELLLEIVDNAKVIVFQEFIYSGRRICQMLEKHGIGHGWLYSGTKDRKALKQRFNTDPECRVLVANNASAALGLNLQVATYAIYYESPVSPIYREQTEARILRTGQTKNCHYIDLVMRGSVDNRVLEFVKEGRDLLKELLSGKRRRDLLGTSLKHAS